MTKRKSTNCIMSIKSSDFTARNTHTRTQRGGEEEEKKIYKKKMVQISELVTLCIAREEGLGLDRPVIESSSSEQTESQDRKDKKFQISELEHMYTHTLNCTHLQECKEVVLACTCRRER